MLPEVPSAGFIAPRNASGCSVIDEPGVVRFFAVQLETLLNLSSLDEESELDSDLSSTLAFLFILFDFATPQIVHFFANNEMSCASHKARGRNIE